MLHVKPGTVVIPFSSMSKEGRDEIWNLIDSLVFDEETLLAMKQEEEAKREAKSAAKEPLHPSHTKRSAGRRPESRLPKRLKNAEIRPRAKKALIIIKRNKVEIES